MGAEMRVFHCVIMMKRIPAERSALIIAVLWGMLDLVVRGVRRGEGMDGWDEHEIVESDAPVVIP